MSKYAPGPWTIVDNEIFSEKTGKQIATVRYATSQEKMLANARLIAAAPELLEACKAAVDFLENEIMSGYGSLDKLRAAIAKAQAKEG